MLQRKCVRFQVFGLFTSPSEHSFSAAMKGAKDELNIGDLLPTSMRKIRDGIAQKHVVVGMYAGDARATLVGLEDSEHCFQ